MKWPYAWMTATILLIVSCDSTPKAAAEKQIEYTGFWIRETNEFKPSDYLAVVLIEGEYFIENGIDFDGFATLEGNALMTGDEKGDVTYSSDGSIAYFGGSEFKRTSRKELEKHLAPFVAEQERVGCAMNLRGVQTAMRSCISINSIDIGSGLDKSFLRKFDGIPKCPSGGTYTFKDKVTDIGVLYCTCSLAKEKGLRRRISRTGE